MVKDSDPILTSKITAPGAPDWAVARRRITDLIAQGTRWCPLTVLTGPAGAGKTMALALWAAAEPGPVTWVSLDEFDNRPRVFWSYVVAALRRSGLTVPIPPAARGRSGEELFLLRLTAALADQDRPVTLILDDLHLITEPRVLKGLDFLLRNAGAGLRLVVASRMNPPLPLYRYRVAGQLAEIRASDLAFDVDEAGLLLARQGCTLTAGMVESLTRRTEGWAAGLRLAAISLGTHPDPGQFVTDLAAENSALTGYLVDEVLNAQPPEVQDVLLCTSILEQFSADAAAALAGDERAAGMVRALVDANAFVQPVESGWYRYHTLYAEVLRLKLRRRYPGRDAELHRRAARWYAGNGLLTDAVRHAARAGDWSLAAELVIDQLAIGQIIEPGPGWCLAEEFASMPSGQAWTGPQPHLILAAVALSAGQPERCAEALDTADRVLAGFPADQQATGRLAAEVIRLAAALRAGDPVAAAAAASDAELMLSRIPGGQLARHPDLPRRVRSGRRAIGLWSSDLDQAAKVLEAAAATAATGGEDEPADSAAYLALVEALRGRLDRAAGLAGQTTQTADEQRPPGQNPNPAALLALAWVHLQRQEPQAMHSCLKQADAALGVSPDKLIGAAGCLVTASAALADGHAEAAMHLITRVRSGGPVPAWLEQQLNLVESRACAAAGDTQAALAAAERAGGGTSLAAAVTFAQATAAAGDRESARRALAALVAADSSAPDQVRARAWLMDAQLSYADGDITRSRRSLASALRLAEREQVRLPFVAERSWLRPLLRRDPELAAGHRRLLAPALGHEQPAPPRRASDQPAPPRGTSDQATVLVVEPLTEREREVLVHLSGLLTTAEVASEMYISVNTVKSHLRNIFRKLATDHRGGAVRRARQLNLI
jgi:LuxR family transcriptional regulator, maltose regulon positive regulatory protein